MLSPLMSVRMVGRVPGASEMSLVSFFRRTPCTRSNLASPHLDGRLKKPIDKASERVPVSEFMIAPDALSAALSLDPAERDALSARARMHGQAKFSLEAMQRATLQIYDQQLGTRLADTFTAAKMPQVVPSR